MFEFEHVNCRNFGYIYGRLLSYYFDIKDNTFVLKDRFISEFVSNEMNDSYIELCYEDNKVIGFIHYHLNDHYKYIEKEIRCEISLLVVDPLYRNNGIASKLLRDSFHFMNEKDVNECYLESSYEIDPVGYEYWINRGAKEILSINEDRYNVSLFKFEDINSSINKMILKKY